MSKPDIIQNSSEGEWLTINEAAHQAGVTAFFIYSALKRGQVRNQLHQQGKLVLLADVLALRDARRARQQKGSAARERRQKRAQRRWELAQGAKERTGDRGGQLKPLAEAVLEVVKERGKARASEVHQALIRQYGASYAAVRSTLLAMTASGLLRRDDKRRYRLGDDPNSI